MQLDFAKHNDRKKYQQSRQLEEEKNDMKDAKAVTEPNL